LVTVSSQHQHYGAPGHRARETFKLLKAVTPDFMPPNS